MTDNHERPPSASEGSGDNDSPLPVVAIAASAGGLEQITTLLKQMPTDTGAAFVILQHLDPTRTSQLPELLDRATELPVVEIANHMPLGANRVHVIPAGHHLGIEDSRLRLTPGIQHESMPTLIDRFFRDLADARGNTAIGVILSGTGSDGALGAKAIRAAGGLILVQDPDSAEYDGMPQAAARNAPAGCMLKTEAMAETLGNHLRFNIPSGRNAGPSLTGDTTAPDDDQPASVRASEIQPVDDDTLATILELLRRNGGHDFSNHKPNMLKRRILRRMGLNGIASAHDYQRKLEDSQPERTRLRQDFLISVTDFFRDPDSYEILAESALDTLLNGRDVDDTIRVWVPGCATGEEAYSIAMLLEEKIETSGNDYNYIVFATDIDDSALDTARLGLYPRSIENDVSPERLRSFFEKTDSHYQIRRSLREHVVFAVQSVVDDPPYSQLDLVSCRNLLIYLNTQTQQRLIRLFHFALGSGCFLFLGSSESVGEQIDLFEPVAQTHRLFRRIGTSRRRALEFPAAYAGHSSSGGQQTPTETTEPPEDVALIARDILLQDHVPATVLINRKQEILCSYGPTRDYLSLPFGESSLGLMEMVRAEFRSPLRAVVHQVVREDHAGEATATLADALPDDPECTLRITARALEHPAAARGLVLVVFEPVARAASAGTDDEAVPAGDTEQQLADELDATRRELHDTIAALEAANEDLKGSNEEILSMNEELQSSNEELETSKEELQSLNEELTTVNGELEAKVRELETAHDDLNNLFAGTQIGTIFLDRAMRIKRFTPAIDTLVNLLASDVGRPLRDMTFKFADPELLDDADTVLDDLTVREREVQAEGGGWYLRRILPYRTRDNVIKGVVITFADITDLKRAALASQEHEQRLDLAMNAIDGGIWDIPINPDAPDELPDQIYLSTRLKQLLGFTDEQLPDSLEAWQARILPEDRKAFNDIARRSGGIGHSGVHYRIRHRDGSIRWFASHGTVVRDPRDPQSARWIGIDRDITAFKQTDVRARQRQAELRLLADSLTSLVVFVGPDGTVGYTNNSFNEWFDIAPNDIAGRDIKRLFEPEAREALQPCLDTALQGRVVSTELPLSRRDDGRTQHFNANLTPHMVDGEVLGLYLVMSHVGDGTISGLDAHDRQDRLTRLHRMATVGELASTLAHDLNQPLNAINTYAGALTRMLHADKPVDETEPMLHKIADQVERASNIVSDTRNFVGRGHDRLEDTDLNNVLHRALTLLDGRARDMNVDVRLHTHSPLPSVWGDMVKLEQVVVNVVTNAFEAMTDIARDKRTLWVRSEQPDSDHVQLTITDSGDGIAAEKIGAIFDSYHTTKLEGMGMGLAICRAIVESHGGQMWAESEIGDGAAFYIRLPAATSDADAS